MIFFLVGFLRGWLDTQHAIDHVCDPLCHPDGAETLLIRGKSRTIRRIKSIHFLDRKDSVVRDIIL